MNDPIKAKIIEAVPEIAYVDPHQDGYGGFDPEWTERPITLADVLRAIAMSKEGKLKAVRVDMQEKILAILWMSKDPENPDHSVLIREDWNLATDYDGQTEEVKTFIGKILGVTS